MNNNAESYLIAGVLGSIACAIFADIAPGWVTNLTFYRLTLAIPIGCFAFAWHVSKQDYTVRKPPSNTPQMDEFPSEKIQEESFRRLNRKV